MRLIDADSLIKSIEGNRDCSDMPSQWIDGVNYAIDLIELYELAIDAVEVVRCKHCRRWLNGDDTYGTCQWNEYQTLQTRYDDYCSHAERND